MKKSVLFICADQWRWDCFGFMKHKNAVTPNLDELAKKSTVFKSHFAGIVPCGPARTTMLTGLYPFIHRSVGNGIPLDKRFTNIAKEVRGAGYDPKLFGHTDTTWDPRNLKDDDEKKFTYESPMEGFDPVCHLTEGDPSKWEEHLKSKGYPYLKSKGYPYSLYQRENPKKGTGYIYKAWDIPTEDSDTSFLASQVIENLKNVKSPFFFHVSFFRPHPPIFVSEPWHSLINPSDVEIPHENFDYEEMLKHHPLLIELTKRYINEKNYSEIRYNELTNQDKQNIIAVYLGMCAEVDHNIGKIIEALKENNLDEDTLIIFTSDHGEMLGENKMWDKFGWMDSAYRIPLIIHDPNLKPQVIHNFTESVDLAPTIIEWIGSDVPINWNGQSLLQYIKNGNDPLAKKYVTFEFDFRASFLTTFVKNKVLTPEECNFIGIRNSKWKYIHFPSLPPLLFDLENDPYEMKNLANNKKYTKIINDLLGQLISHRILHQDRQLSSLHISKDGVSSNYGPPSRKLIN